MSADDRVGPPVARRSSRAPAATSASQAGARLFGRNFVYVAVSTLPLVVGTIASPVLVRLMSPVEFGALATAITVVQVLAILTVLGLDQAVLVEHGREGGVRIARGLVATGTALAAAVSLLLAITAPAWSHLVGFADRVPLAVGVAVWTAPAAAAYLALQALLGQDRIGPFVVLTCITGLAGPVMAISVLLLVGGGATTYVWVNVGAQLVAAVVGQMVVRPRASGLWDLSSTVDAFRLGLPLALGAVSTFVLSSGDRLIVQAFEGVESVARYQVSYIIGSTVIIVLGFVQGAWVPRLAAVAEEQERARLMRAAQAQLVRVVVPAVLGVVLVAPAALLVLSTPEYRPESLLPVAVVVVLAAFPVAVVVTSNAFLITTRRGRAVMTGALVAAGSNIVLNVALVPLLGILGAALATLVAYSVQAVVVRRLVPERSDGRAPMRAAALPLGAVLASALTLLLPWSTETIIARFVAAAVCAPWLLREVLRARRLTSEPATTTPTDDDRRHEEAT